MTITIGAINACNKTKPIQVMLNKNPDALAVSEAYGSGPRKFVMNRPRYRGYVGGHGGADLRRGGFDNPVLTRKNLRNLGTLAVIGCLKSTPIKIAPERWITVSCFAKDGLWIAVISVHPHAAVRGQPKKVDRVAKYATFIQRLAATIDYLRAIGMVPVVAGDLNFPKGAASPDWTDPYEMFKTKGLTAYSVGLDAIAWGGRLQATKRQSWTAKQVGSDHPGLLVTLKKR